MTAFVAPVLPFAFSRWGICNDMVGMGIVFVVGDEEGGGRRRRWRCGQESGEGPEAWEVRGAQEQWMGPCGCLAQADVGPSPKKKPM